MTTTTNVKQEYVHGSEGCRNLFFRAKGTVYEVRGVEEPQVQVADVWVIQWEGYPDHDSGYSSCEFNNEADALEAF
jgi:hypothetical protein